MTERTTKPIQIRITEQALTIIKAVAKENKRPTSVEVSERLEASARPEPEGSLALTGPLAAALEAIGQYLGDWRQDRFAHDVLKAVTMALLDRYRPSGDPVCHPIAENMGDIFFSLDDTPVVAAKTILGIALSKAPLRPFATEIPASSLKAEAAAIAKAKARYERSPEPDERVRRVAIGKAPSVRRKTKGEAT